MGLGITIAVNGSADKELDRAASVEVYETMGKTTGYSIRFDVEISKGDIPLLADKRLDVGSELSILVPMGDKTHCLVKGPVHGHKIHLEHGGAGSWLEVKGSDNSIKMDRETKSVIWSGTDSDAVNSILGNYGYTPDVQSTKAGHSENKHTLIQRETDLRFVRRLARRNGFLFWTTCDSSGSETAHFKRPPIDESAAAELTINLESPTLQTLDITWDLERPTSVEGKQLDLNSKSNLDGAVNQTPQSILGDKGLKAITNDKRSVHVSAPADDAGDMQSRGEGALIEADWFIRATCKASPEQLNALVRAHTIVNVRGVGKRHSGKYFVSRVRHIMDAASHQMEIELLRNGWGA